jgi:hypothetical protein
MQCLTIATNDPLPLFFRIADSDSDPHLGYLFGRQRPGTRIEAMSWYWHFLLMIIVARRLNSGESGCLRFKYSFSTNLSPWKALQFTNYNAVNGNSLRLR